eukprot:5043215-Amphidinium_carterae.2
MDKHPLGSEQVCLSKLSLDFAQDSTHQHNLTSTIWCVESRLVKHTVSLAPSPCAANRFHVKFNMEQVPSSFRGRDGEYEGVKGNHCQRILQTFR